VKADHRRIDRDMRKLAVDIGERYSGTRGEQQAADHIQSQMTKAGLVEVRQEPFTFPNWTYTRCELRAGKPGRLKPIATAFPRQYTVSTPRDGIEGDVVYVESLDALRAARGKIALIAGAIDIDARATIERLAACGVKAIIMCDTRSPFDWRMSVGAAAMSAGENRLPQMAIAFMDAVALAKQLMTGRVRAKLTIAADAFPAESGNVIGEIAGAKKPSDMIVVSCHHDSVMHVKGADDNASGVFLMLETARLLAKQKLRRTVRFVSCGVEEKLSVGAYMHMRTLAAQRDRRVVLGVNADGVGAVVGQDRVRVTGNAALRRMVERHWHERGHAAVVEDVVTPFSDHFAMNMLGAPTVWIGRPSVPGGSGWTLHSRHDNIDNVNPKVIARNAETAATLIERVANAARLPFPAKLDPAVAKQVRAMAREVYRHPWSPKRFDYSPWRD
jgi:hypothetical protein